VIGFSAKKKNPNADRSRNRGRQKQLSGINSFLSEIRLQDGLTRWIWRIGYNRKTAASYSTRYDRMFGGITKTWDQ
jgi:hypothetical protein